MQNGLFKEFYTEMVNVLLPFCQGRICHQGFEDSNFQAGLPGKH